MAWVAGASPEIRSQSKWRDVVITMLVPTIVAILTVALRFWVRWRQKLHSEDWITLGTMVWRWDPTLKQHVDLDISQFFSIAYTSSGVVRKSINKLGFPASNCTNVAIETRFGLGLPWALRPAEYTREYLIANYAAWPVCRETPSIALPSIR